LKKLLYNLIEYSKKTVIDTEDRAKTLLKTEYEALLKTTQYHDLENFEHKFNTFTDERKKQLQKPKDKTKFMELFKKLAEKQEKEDEELRKENYRKYTISRINNNYEFINKIDPNDTTISPRLFDYSGDHNIDLRYLRFINIIDHTDPLPTESKNTYNKIKKTYESILKTYKTNKRLHIQLNTFFVDGHKNLSDDNPIINIDIDNTAPVTINKRNKSDDDSDFVEVTPTILWKNLIEKASQYGITLD